MEISIHNVVVKDFLRLLPVMFESIEWEKEVKGKKFYMSGSIRIKELEITLFTNSYDIALGVAEESKVAKSFKA